tara:strand:+ start:213 stop:503 length:291 start_codon:yes stop_codon:yes gene_type:complete
VTKLINVLNGDKVETYILTKLLITKENIMSRFKDHLMQKEQELDEQIIYMNKMINDTQGVIDRLNDTRMIRYWTNVRNTLQEQQQDLQKQKTGISY